MGLGEFAEGGEGGSTLAAFYPPDLTGRQTFNIALAKALFFPQGFYRCAVCFVEIPGLLLGLQMRCLIDRAFELFPAKMDVSARPVDEGTFFVDLERLRLFFAQFL
jgi:hypothetical protein